MTKQYKTESEIEKAFDEKAEQIKSTLAAKVRKAQQAFQLLQSHLKSSKDSQAQVLATKAEIASLDILSDLAVRYHKLLEMMPSLYSFDDANDGANGSKGEK